MANFASVSDVKNYIGNFPASDENLLTSLLTRTTKLIQQYVGRDLIQDTYTNIQRNGNGQRILQVQNYPIVSVTNIYDDVTRTFGSDSLLIEDTGGLYSTAHYVIEGKGEIENTGHIIRLDGVWTRGIKNIRMTYVGGYASVPTDLVQAQIDWTTYIYKNKDMRIGVSSYRLGDFNIAFKDNVSRNSSGDIIGPALPPDDIRMILDNYRDSRMESTFEEYGDEL